MQTKSRVEPSIPLTDPKYRYTHSSKTDVVATFKRFGWVPPTEVKAKANRTWGDSK
jgi:hypothetical protein